VLIASTPEAMRFLAVAVLALMFAVVGVNSPRYLLLGLIIWLTSLGLLRRLANSIIQAGSFGDPLLLIGPATVVVLLMAALQTAPPRRRNVLVGAVLLLTVTVLASAVNPMQGGLVVGLGGLLLTLPPMLMFWVGRSLCNDHLIATVLKLVGGLAVPAALYGLVQTFRGFPSWDERWILQSGYAALGVGGVTRAFSSFSAASEYATYLAIGIVVWSAFGLRSSRPIRLPAILGVLLLLGASLAYEASRGILVLTILSIGLMVAARCGARLIVALLILVVLALSVPFIASKLLPTGDDTGSVLLTHQARGLGDPLGEASTLPVHLQLVLEGMRSAVADPIGRGIGSVTIAASKYSGLNANTEADLSNLAVATGLPGMLAYLVLIASGFNRAYKLAVQRRDALSEAALGVLVATFLHWTNGGQYAVALLPWLVLGWVEGRAYQQAAHGVLTRSREAAIAQ
jgi:hypothetical protein